MNKKKDTINIEQYPLLYELLDMFLEELHGLPPKRELDFRIQLKPVMQPIVKAPYNRKTPKL